MCTTQFFFKHKYVVFRFAQPCVYIKLHRSDMHGITNDCILLLYAVKLYILEKFKCEYIILFLYTKTTCPCCYTVIVYLP